jgi:hypothetical protein
MSRFGISKTLAAAMLVLAPVGTQAHGSMEPQHGGIVKMSGEIMVELVSTARGLSFYVTEEDEPIPAAGFDGSITLTAPGGAKTSHALVAQRGNLFTVSGARAPRGSKIVVSLVEKRSGAKTFVTFQS